jgi:hypothetical protein
MWLPLPKWHKVRILHEVSQLSMRLSKLWRDNSPVGLETRSRENLLSVLSVNEHRALTYCVFCPWTVCLSVYCIFCSWTACLSVQGTHILRILSLNSVSEYGADRKGLVTIESVRLRLASGLCLSFSISSFCNGLTHSFCTVCKKYPINKLIILLKLHMPKKLPS